MITCHICLILIKMRDLSSHRNFCLTTIHKKFCALILGVGVLILSSADHSLIKTSLPIILKITAAAAQRH